MLTKRNSSPFPELHDRRSVALTQSRSVYACHPESGPLTPPVKHFLTPADSDSLRSVEFLTVSTVAGQLVRLMIQRLGAPLSASGLIHFWGKPTCAHWRHRWPSLEEVIRDCGTDPDRGDFGMVYARKLLKTER